MEEVQQLPGLSVLGCGYDATGEYANARSVRYRIFDLGAYDSTIKAPNGETYSVPSSLRDEILRGDIGDGTYDHFSGESAEKYRTSLSTQVKVSGSYGLFSGSVTSSFRQEELASFNHEFVCVLHKFSGWVVALPQYSTLTMNEQARDHIEKAMDPMDVILNYGTHVLMSAVIGGRGEYTCFVDRSKLETKTDIATVAEASYKAALSLDVEAKTEYEKDVETFSRSAKTRFRTVGGEFEPEFDPESFGQWMRSFKKHPVLVDFTDRSLVEIYKLASSEQRRAELEAAYNKYIEDSQQLVPDIPLLEVERVTAQSVDFIASDAGSGASMNLAVYRPKLPQGWNWVGHSATNNELIRVKALVPGAVSEPLGYSREWTDAGSGNDHGYSLWNISPQHNYLALGGIARLRTGRTDWAEPHDNEVEGLVCIHESLCTEGQIGRMIWNDHGTHARADGSVWEINPQDDQNGIDAHTFFAQGSHARPTAKVYVIKRGPKVTVKE